MSEISSLSPLLLWKWFDKICEIPHPSYHEEQLAHFIIDWAKSQSLFAERDEVGNVLIRKPATKGMENRQKVVLQAHLDMVPQANEGTDHNFTKDPIQPYIDGEWVTAKNTTLGADNGIGLASCLAVLESNDIAHPDLEVLLTMTEETGMAGAVGLRPNWLQGDILINTDTEDNGEIYVGCAGGEDASFDIPVQYEDNKFDTAIQISLKGLRGGHSGCDIHTTRGNAIKLMVRFLEALKQQVEFQLIDIQGGSVRNAIPREAVTSIAFFAKNNDNVTAFIKQFEAKLQQELAIAEPNLVFLVEEIQPAQQIFTQKSTTTVINTLNILPNGIIRNSDVVEGVVETSLSTGVLKTENNQVSAIILVRSLVEEGKIEVQGKLRALAELVGARVTFSGSYPGWNPDPNSKITPITKQVYDKLLGYESKIKVIHAGLECGLLKKAYPNIDMVSIGPTIRNAHSPDEKAHIPAVQIYWDLLVELLKNIPTAA
ncbi:aminoacyl-histidine dipeptidase [Pasteurella atlantica]|uniref:Aminoacyl-histidine dipeptidase n=2 Tax=Pasteurellaceae TaxID=712 RepID=A0ACC6HNM9_9PAST|nr:aminoacyl-histidine dipeptidase [Pasteurella atlantica]MDP8052399.1 aminoacyl-histidine dipeptidase [Pasteurella atlantica]MDP8105184.1 aminoacyl-histidine dipeptidase [Pasteurella atlantica]MDP8148668.1 aminoacyl-histidine dipeptidase [Pasteurella atlantica]